jgi:hypothetical protein
MKKKETYTVFRFRRILKVLFCLIAGLHLVTACSVLQTQMPVTELASLQNQRAASEHLALQELQDIDTLIRLDNRWLAKQFETVLKAQAKLDETYSFRKLKIKFTNQIIILESIVDILDENGNVISAALSGEIVLKYRGNGLEWHPRFSQLQITSKDFSFAGVSYTEANPELTRATLQNLDTDLAQAVVENGRNTIPLNPVPLGEIQVGASLPGFAGSTARYTQSLRGVFMVAGAVVLVDSSITSIALDLAFIPDLSTCPADVTVSRAEFVRDVQSREPVGIARHMNSAADVNYFYSVIADAQRPLTIIHYWFADGLPLTVEELPVGPSERWRTWSAKGTATSNASRWEVLVVEKESGCILASKAIRTIESEPLVKDVNEVQAKKTFVDLKNAFNQRTVGFSIIDDKPGIALIEVTRSFLQEVLRSSLADLNIDAEFDEFTSPVLQYSAQLQAFDTDEIICESHDCSPAPLCKTNLTRCTRRQDSRDCSSCQFRNPLNNRCVSEAIDPLCEAARNRQNARYDSERAACISGAENVKQECDRLNAQALRSCQIESSFEESACESVKASFKAFDQEAPVATVSAQANASGTLRANFSNFLIEGDLERLKLDVSLHSMLQLDGKLNFKPVSQTQSLDKCIAAWSAPFKNRFANISPFNNLLSNLQLDQGMLTAQWSGFGITIETQPSPLESAFVDNPQLLANCKIGLTVNKVEQAIAGDDDAFFRGEVNLVLQTLPTKIHLAPATIQFGNMVYSAQANLSARHLLYDIGE